jgi:hypothetical protein
MLNFSTLVPSYKKFILGSLIFFIFFPIRAQSETLTLSDILVRIEENYSFDKEFNLIGKKLKSEKNHVSSLYNPEISAGKGRIDNSSFKGPYQQWSISQTFEINGQKSLLKKQYDNYEKIDLNLNRLSQREFQSHILQMIYQLKSEKAHLEHVNERIQQLAAVKNYLKNKSFISAKDQISRTMIENLFDEINLSKIMMSRNIEILKNKLMVILNLNEDPLFNLPWLNLKQIQSSSKFYNIDNEASLKISEAKISEIDQNQKIANQEWIPDLNLTYSESRENIPGGNRNDTLSLAIKVPLFNINKNLSSALNSQKEIAQILQQRNKNDLQKQVQEFSVELDMANKVINELNDSTLAKKDKMEKIFLNHFKQGQIDAISYLEIEKQTHSFHEIAMEATLKGHLALFEILKLKPLTLPLEKFINENLL